MEQIIQSRLIKKRRSCSVLSYLW